MIIDACYNSQPIETQGKLFSQNVTLKFFDGRRLDFKIKGFNDSAMFPESKGALRRCPIEVSSFDRQIKFQPVGKAFDVITDIDYFTLRGQPIMVFVHAAEVRNNNASRYSTSTNPRTDQYLQDCIIFDPKTLADTGLVAPLMLKSEKSAYDPGFYRAEIYFSSKKDKYDSPIPTVKIAGDSLGEYTPDLLAQAS